eukprot:501807-Pyramimonas_sp.AAC.1
MQWILRAIRQGYAVSHIHARTRDFASFGHSQVAAPARIFADSSERSSEGGEPDAKRARTDLAGSIAPAGGDPTAEDIVPAAPDSAVARPGDHPTAEGATACYLVQLKDITGKFDVEKAKALGVPVGGAMVVCSLL